ncbi:MAG: alkaline phosphatase family protein [Phycisphaerae bacterium]|nr:alkaline phosphatase family protein [Phycisphaerae bacterium]
MADRLAIIDVVGLSRNLVGSDTPRIRAHVEAAGGAGTLIPPLPAVTCTVQSSIVTGTSPSDHGIVGNGWFNRELQEIQFWKQSNKLVNGPRLWEQLRDARPGATTANMFWWFNMYSGVEYSVTPRPIYKADGRKIPDCYSMPAELRDRLQSSLGRFPLFKFWGPGSSIESSRWISEASMQVHEQFDPTLMLVYVPHMDYCLQKLGPGHEGIAKELNLLDEVVGDLLEFFSSRDTDVILLSEYGIVPVDDSVHINRILRESGDLEVRVEDGLELLDAGASSAFAIADHQVAHVHVRDPSDAARIGELLRQADGIDMVLDRAEQSGMGIDNQRSGELLAISSMNRWFSYDYWLDDARAPDFARTVDIHRKPGYDPLELFIDPEIRFPSARIAGKLVGKKLGFRTQMDVIPLDTRLVRGSHGRIDVPAGYEPIICGPGIDHGTTMRAEQVNGYAMDLLLQNG